MAHLLSIDYSSVTTIITYLFIVYGCHTDVEILHHICWNEFRFYIEKNEAIYSIYSISHKLTNELFCYTDNQDDRPDKEEQELKLKACFSPII